MSSEEFAFTDPVFTIRVSRNDELTAQLKVYGRTSWESKYLEPERALIECRVRLEDMASRNPDMTSSQVRERTLLLWWHDITRDET